jgi:hypothetical protein
VVTGAGQVLEDIWKNPGALVDWMDQEIPIPGLRGYYRGLTEGRFSFFDVICLIAAMTSIPRTATAPIVRPMTGDGIVAASAQGGSDVDGLGLTLGILSAVTGAVIALIDCEVVEGKSFAAWMRFVFVIDACVSICYVSRTLLRQESTDGLIAGIVLIGAGMPLAGYYFYRASYDRAPFGSLSALLLVYSMVHAGVERLNDHSDLQIASYSILGFETLAMGLVRSYVQWWAKKPLHPAPALGVAGIKLACACTRAGLNNA